MAFSAPSVGSRAEDLPSPLDADSTEETSTRLAPPRPRPSFDKQTLLRHQIAFVQHRGSGIEGDSANDRVEHCMSIPLAVLSKPHLLYDYFKQRFAQANQRLTHCGRKLG